MSRTLPPFDAAAAGAAAPPGRNGLARSLHGLLGLAAAVVACGGGAPPRPPVPPGPPAALLADTGDRAFSVGWDPPADDGGAAVQGYAVTVVPDLPGSGATTGRTALLRDAANGTEYTVSVAARNAAGTGTPRVIQVTPRAYASAGETALAIQGDDSPSGIYDPSVLVSGAHAWMSYSSVDYHTDAQDHRVQDVGIRIARSDDGGASWTLVRTVVAPSDATLPDPGQTVCGQPTCQGRWVHETSWLVEDPTAAASERFKLFAHRYFLYPPDATVAGKSATLYHLGAIVLWSASSPDGLGASPPRTVLRWNLTPAAITGGQNVNGIPALSACIVVAEGGASVRGGTIDLVLACPYPGPDPLPQKIVLLRSTDHARTFGYVTTLLDAPDASWLPGASFFTAPSVLAGPDAAPVLLVTPAFGGVYGGCAVIPFEDPQAGTLWRVGGLPAVIRLDPTAPQTIGGACAAARALPGVGLLRNEGSQLGSWPPLFRILRGRAL